MKTLREEIEMIVRTCEKRNCAECDRKVGAVLFLCRQAMEEVVGEDETGDQIKDLPQVQSFIAGRRNQLRAEQRERANQIMPKE